MTQTRAEMYRRVREFMRIAERNTDAFNRAIAALDALEAQEREAIPEHTFCGDNDELYSLTEAQDPYPEITAENYQRFENIRGKIRTHVASTPPAPPAAEPLRCHKCRTVFTCDCGILPAPPAAECAARDSLDEWWCAEPLLEPSDLARPYKEQDLRAIAKNTRSVGHKKQHRRFLATIDEIRLIWKARAALAAPCCEGLRAELERARRDNALDGAVARRAVEYNAEVTAELAQQRKATEEARRMADSDLILERAWRKKFTAENERLRAELAAAKSEIARLTAERDEAVGFSRTLEENRAHLERQCVKFLAELRQAVDALRQVQWGTVNVDEDGTMCPVCGNSEAMAHAQACHVGMVITAYDAKHGEGK